MRLKTVNKSSEILSNFSLLGGKISGPLKLNRNPVEPNEAVTKYYLDNYKNNLSINDIITGTLPIGRMPSFNGDFTNLIGSNIFTLKNNGVTVGTYTRITVDSKGRVVAGSNIVSSDIPNLSWNKITTGKPTTLSGYGITDGVSINNPQVTGYVNLHSQPINNEHLGTKGYISNLLNTASSPLKTGDTVRRPSINTPSGFLRCNGGEVNIADYTALYSVIGDVNSYRLVPGDGKPWQNQYNINNVTSNDLTKWDNYSVIPYNTANGAMFRVKNKIYYIASGNTTVFTCEINSDNSLSDWRSYGVYPNTVSVPAAPIVLNTKVHIFGGTSPNYNGYYTATINSDGTLGSWIGTSQSFFTLYSSTLVTGNKVYLIGGRYNNGAEWNRVFVSTINADDSLSDFTQLNTLPNKAQKNFSFVTTSRAYVISFDNIAVNVYVSILDANKNITTWSQGISMPTYIVDGQAFIYNNKVYVIGGSKSTGKNTDIYVGNIDSNGILDSWTIKTSNITWISGETNTTIVIDKKLYIISSYNYAISSNNIISADINSDGNLTNWKNLPLPMSLSGYAKCAVTKNKVYFIGATTSKQYMADIDSDGNLTNFTEYLGATYAGTNYNLTDCEVLAHNNYLYILGGYNSNIVYMIPINSDGSLGEWSTTTPLPGNIYTSSSGVIIKDKIYMICGRVDNVDSKIVYYSTINSDGTLGSWQTGPDYPVATRYHKVAVIKNKLYVFAGYSTKNVYYSEITENGLLTTWVMGNPFPVAKYNYQLITTTNMVYILGGNTSALVLYSAVINSDGTLQNWVSTNITKYDTSYNAYLVTKNKLYIFYNNTYNTCNISGGLNDYSPYYDSSFSTISSDKFKLPDTTLTDKGGIYTFIKT